MGSPKTSAPSALFELEFWPILRTTIPITLGKMIAGAPAMSKLAPTSLHYILESRSMHRSRTDCREIATTAWQGN